MMDISHILRAPLSKAQATSWATAADMAGTGTSIVQSDIMYLPFSALPSFWDLAIEVAFTLARTGGSGEVYAWMMVSNQAVDLITSDNTAPSKFYSPRSVVSSPAQTRRILVRPRLIMGAYASVVDQYLLLIRAAGQSAEDAFAVSNIKSRLLYIPM